MRTIKKKYHYFYKITNNINNHYYYGIHSTDNLDDGYMGSGIRLKYAYEKYGIENFTKEILKFFETRDDAAKYEAEVVTEVLIRDNECYNIVQGGETMSWVGTVTAIDKNGKGYRVPIDDIRLKTGEFTYCTVGKGVYKDKNGKHIFTNNNDPKVLSGELVGTSKGTGVYKDKNGSTMSLPVDDPKVLSGEVVGVSKNYVVVKDKNNNYFTVTIDDPRYLSGELKHLWCGRKHKPETIEKYKRTFKEIKHQQGEKNSMYGRCWIIKDGISKSIQKEELETYIQQGWKKGRICKKKNNN